MGGARGTPTSTVRLTPAQFQVLEALGAHGPAHIIRARRFSSWEHAGGRWIEVSYRVSSALVRNRWIRHDGAPGTYSLTDGGRELAAREESRRAAREVVA